jgi:hypothetical protein
VPADPAVVPDPVVPDVAVPELPEPLIAVSAFCRQPITVTVPPLGRSCVALAELPLVCANTPAVIAQLTATAVAHVVRVIVPSSDCEICAVQPFADLADSFTVRIAGRAATAGPSRVPCNRQEIRLIALWKATPLERLCSCFGLTS